MDAFFVSVEELLDPSLKGKPVVVGGKGPERGVVSAASYAARKFGVHSALPLRTAYQRCPQAVFLEGHPKLYREYSQKVHDVLKLYSPTVEQVSIDEAFLDMTGTERLLGRPLAAAHQLHEAVREETGLPCSIGIGVSRLIAKMCSGLAKPNGVLSVEPGAEAAFLAPLEVKRIPGVGKVMQGKLREIGIERIGQLQQLDDKTLGGRFGKWGTALAAKARGEDGGGWFDHEIGSRDQPKSISHETTFGVDSADTTLLDATLAKLVQLVARRLREHKLWSRTVQLKLRYSDFTTLTRSKTLEDPTQLDNVILETVRMLFRDSWNGRRVRLLGVHVGSLMEPGGQMGLLEGDDRRKWEDLLGAADKLRDRFGESAVGLAGAMKHGRRERVHENPAGLPGKSKSDG
ncbi:MAG: DNA polymerase-4 [Myxococcota bacterium]|jgi:DNA polymerase-4